MKTYKLTVMYDGGCFNGWQRQGNTKRTIQEILEDTASCILEEKVEINGSGRTDAGVHAKGQTASMVVSAPFDTRYFLKQMNGKLPEEIKVTEVVSERRGFHARLSAKGKCYEYYIDTRKKQGVFTRKYSYSCPHSLDIFAMKKAALYLEGRHDFASFTDLKEEKSTERTIYKIQIQETEGRVKIVFYGTGFLYHMVRILTGTLLEVGMKKRSPDEIKEILDSKERSKAGFCAPAQGLFLKEVYY